LFAAAAKSPDPALKVENGKNYRRLASAVLTQALRDAREGVELPYLETWVNKEQVELLCLMCETDVGYYRKQLQSILDEKKRVANG
jgi:hypothetical protein